MTNSKETASGLNRTDVVIMKERLLETADVRMRELLQDTDFPSECRSLPGVSWGASLSGRIFPDFVRLDHLDGVPLPTLAVHGLVHGRKRALANFVPEVVVSIYAVPGTSSS